MAAVELKNVAKSYDGKIPIIHGIDLEIKDGEFVVFVGPSGCGKSTLLRMIAGLETISSGELRIGGDKVNDKPPRARDIAMVFQDYALYPHKSLYDNMAFGLRLRKTPEDEIKKRVMDAARLLRIDHMLERKPAALSGGQRQRVAIGRAIVRQPKVFLFDEPLSNLDAQLRQEMRSEIKRLHERLGATMIYVTHDQVEAMTLADRIAVLSAGHKMQYDTPDAIYNRPAALFVAGFTGAPPMNLVDATVSGGQADVGAGIRVALPPALAGKSGPGKLGVRPENLRLAPEAGDITVPAQVSLLEPLGSETLVSLKLGASEVIARLAASFREPPGTTVNLHLNPAHLHLFDPQSGVALA
ncbi:sn-glycerol-3-phosphate ABC transporter ATP-binding protein UgpC [Paucibacter sp. R3-3]|uniref:Sn-glycerol-3-phosphate ABC transporter ATP-binding protein UgpC n=1 Tax=Roseateles agri TaxID=3098619 RepID=A0ABU5DHF7_9BURK|nr:sn-glycerol-3-phosphate ABC transporter ATP-binding protein UgpC [Paucibacter sp. R3-3]MDY0745714.1 sn-glycerol-3-phosphate ABC transporter ATP-binding protein UgpC [Paucibacter sp. R3-3]